MLCSQIYNVRLIWWHTSRTQTEQCFGIRFWLLLCHSRLPKLDFESFIVTIYALIEARFIESIARCEKTYHLNDSFLV